MTGGVLIDVAEVGQVDYLTNQASQLNDEEGIRRNLPEELYLSSTDAEIDEVVRILVNTDHDENYEVTVPGPLTEEECMGVARLVLTSGIL